LNFADKKKKIQPEEITFVVQGVVNDKPTVKKCLNSIRLFFPDSKIILSTWKNSDVSGLDFDELVLSSEDCPIYKFYKHLSLVNNINKQIISSRNGLRYVNTKYAVKMRSDIIFMSDNLLRTITLTNKKLKKNYLNSKIIIPFDLSINAKKTKLLFHFNDWFLAGETQDLRKIFKIPLMSLNDLKFFEKRNNTKPFFQFRNWLMDDIKKSELRSNLISRYAPEQYIFKFIGLKGTNLKLRDAFSYSKILLSAHNNFIKNSILFKASNNISFVNIKHRNNIFSERVSFYTKTQIFAMTYNINILVFFDLTFYFFKSIQLVKIFIYKFSKKLYLNLKILNGLKL
jgi:hypothetical protein